MTRSENKADAQNHPDLAAAAGGFKQLTDWFEAIDISSSASGIDLRGRDAETRRLVWAVRDSAQELARHLDPWKKVGR